MKFRLNFSYGCIHGTYWMIYGIVSSFASVFLLGRGYLNTEIGIILAVANVVAVVIQPLVADLADRSKKISTIGISQIMTIMMMVMTVGLFALQGKSVALSVVFVLLIAWHTAVQPLINSLSFKLSESGIHINFGIARSVGSLSYSLLCAVLGVLVARFGIEVLPISAEIVMAMMAISLLMTKRQYDKIKNCGKREAAEETAAENLTEMVEIAEDINLLEFIRRNKLFFIANIGVIGLYFSNSVMNNYLMQIVTEVGGNSADMGRILSLMAFLEIPTLVFFDKLRAKFTCQFMLKVAAIGFTIKILMCHIAASVSMILAAQVFQLIAFGLFLPAMVHFIDEIMSKGEAVKGQSVFTMMVTITTMLSSLAGGAILDISGAKMLTLVSLIITAAGAVIILATVDRIKK
ncbi:MFS transporter [Anaerotruncus sp. 80]|uniref:MFS transporter n=1 Tax=Anaerotruncus colihominis TaxID=169435 RepID=A0A845QJC1_9FIRM|nr:MULTISPECIES: MFS transporter [Anaerotruncus]NBH62220.1 MFS transporter [Anaerotruncus colihominis]NCF02875.1 MFS transporter [Anaerotruncus sp. 80]